MKKRIITLLGSFLIVLSLGLNLQLDKNKLVGEINDIIKILEEHPGR